MTRIVLFITLLLMALSAGARQYSVGEVPNVHLADSTRFVSNPDGILSESTVASLDRELSLLRRRTTAEMVVVAIDDVAENTDVDRFATDLFTSWGIGKSDRDNGVLLLLVKGQRAVTIRTGQGAEGVVTDLAAGRIIRNIMTPRFREGDYDGGVTAGASQLVALLSDPDSADELRSAQRNDALARRHGDDGPDVLWNAFLVLACILGAGSLVVVLLKLISTRHEDDVTRYRTLERLQMPILLAAFLSLGLGVPALLILRNRMRKARLHPRHCTNCGTAMRRLGEEEDNRYLTPAQDTEERINSVDYDVWLCPQCNNTEVIPYVNRQSAYTECPNCHGRTRALLTDRTVTPPTPMSDGRGVRTYSCRNCGWRKDEYYSIPKVVVMPTFRSGGGNGFGGGGFGGGSFGGGSTMGGGATGRW